jgi:hypothetical protein
MGNRQTNQTLATTMNGAGDPPPFSVHGPWISLAAPGHQDHLTQPGQRQGNRGEIKGTSFAAPTGLSLMVGGPGWVTRRCLSF